MKTHVAPSHPTLLQQQRLQEYANLLISGRKAKVLQLKPALRAKCHKQITRRRFEAVACTVGALILAIGAAQFKITPFHPVVFLMGWAFFRLLQSSINRIVYLVKVRKDETTVYAPAIVLSKSPAFRIGLVLTLLIIFLVSTLFNRGFLFSAGLVWGWMLQSYLRQLRELGVSKKLMWFLHTLMLF